MDKKKILIAMSGGVDSSVCAYLMKKEGHECMGGTMKLYDPESKEISQSHTCCSNEDVEDARQVAQSLDMPYEVFNFMEGFQEKIIDRFIASYERGITPNPCIDCNRYMKFDGLHDKAKELGYDYVATGHYARIGKKDGEFVLKKGLDPKKDQSYVLYSVDQELLAHTLFPLGEMDKQEVRMIAEKAGFINAQKPDSQDICFVPDGDYAKVIQRRTGKDYPQGDFVDSKGNILGKHQGLIHYTIGQRRGLGIAGPKPYYVKEILAEENKVVLAFDEELYDQVCYVKNFHWISNKKPSKSFSCKAKIRYRHKEEACRVELIDDTFVKLSFDKPQRAITPGQSAVLYDGDIVLGGGVIVSSEK